MHSFPLAMWLRFRLRWRDGRTELYSLVSDWKKIFFFPSYSVDLRVTIGLHSTAPIACGKMRLNSGGGGSFVWDCDDRVPVSQKVWHDKDPSCQLNARRCQIAKVDNFAALHRQWWRIYISEICSSGKLNSKQEKDLSFFTSCFGIFKERILKQ